MKKQKKAGERKKIRNKIVIQLFFVLSVIHPTRATVVNWNSIEINDIEYYIQTDKAIYNLGEDVDFLYIVTNLRDEEWRIEWSFPVFDVVAEEKNGENFNEIWNWSWDQIYPHGPVVVTLGPQESIELNEIWPQIDLNGSVEIEDHTQVPPGLYRIAGVCHPTDVSIPVNITIIPEPTSLALLGMGLVRLLIHNKKRKH
jgi:hypothetical protein